MENTAHLSLSGAEQAAQTSPKEGICGLFLSPSGYKYSHGIYMAGVAARLTCKN
jgi:hypothetical protein